MGFITFKIRSSHSLWSNLKILCVILISNYSCIPEKTSQKPAQNQNSSLIKYAKGFELEVFKDYTVLKVKTPYQNSNTNYKYILAKDSYKTKDNDKVIKIPIHKIIATSTTHVAMIEALQEETSLVGFPNRNYISSIKTRKRIDQNFVKEVGMDANLNTEVIVDLNPDVIVGFSVNASNKSLDALQKMGIPILYNGAWLEETPLGRAEWIKFFGAIYDKNEMADSIFKVIEQNYLNIKTNAATKNKQPTILAGSMFKDVWNVPAGDSFMAQFLKDANANYLWKETKGTGSLQLNFENVLDKAKNADLWIGPGAYISRHHLESNNPHYANFKAFKSGEIYTFSKRKGATGGTMYYELGALRPDLILKDIIKIAHPELLLDEDFTFFDKVD